jgi:hypothetical protein
MDESLKMRMIIINSKRVTENKFVFFMCTDDLSRNIFAEITGDQIQETLKHLEHIDLDK